MIIRQDRQKLIELIHSYMDEKITAFQLDDELWKLYTSKDETVAWVSRAIWYYYDDCIDHKIHASKEVWDFFWRCLLLLESSTEINIKKTWHWRLSQLPGLVFLCLFGLIACYTGWGPHLLIIAPVFGLIGILLYDFTRIETKINILTYPFSSFSEIRSTRKHLSSFSKQSFPKHLKDRHLRSHSSDIFPSVMACLLSMLLGPFVLFFASLPQRQKHVSIQFSV